MFDPGSRTELTPELELQLRTEALCHDIAIMATGEGRSAFGPGTLRLTLVDGTVVSFEETESYLYAAAFTVDLGGYLEYFRPEEGCLAVYTNDGEYTHRPLIIPVDSVDTVELV